MYKRQAEQRADGQHRAPGKAVQCVGRDKILLVHHSRQVGLLSRGKDGAEDELERGQHIEQPDALRPIHEQKAQHRHGAQYIRPDQQRAPLEAVGQHPGKGTHHKERQKARQEEKADRSARAAQCGDQRGRGEQVEPVAQVADDARKPQIAEVAIPLQEGKIEFQRYTCLLYTSRCV